MNMIFTCCFLFHLLMCYSTTPTLRSCAITTQSLSTNYVEIQPSPYTRCPFTIFVTVALST